jgi:hypothetical protein
LKIRIDHVEAVVLACRDAKISSSTENHEFENTFANALLVLAASDEGIPITLI